MSSDMSDIVTGPPITPNMSKICRVCLVLIQNDEPVRINTVEESTGFMPLRDKLALCVPEMVLDMIQDPVLCKTCTSNLETAYGFKQQCLHTEEKIRRLIQSVGGVLYSIDLGKIITTKVAQKTKAETPVPVRRRRPMVIKKIISPPNFRPIAANPTVAVVPRDPLALDGPEEVPEVPEVLEVVKHEETVETSEEVFVESNWGGEKPIRCNFCASEFPDMYMLRAHQRICPEAPNTSPEEPEAAPVVQLPGPMLRRRRRTVTRTLKTQPGKTEAVPAKRKSTRTTLPPKAKSILQKWLFLHRWNPYPCDAEKLILIKQTNLTLVQVENWFINARRRVLQRMMSKNYVDKETWDGASLEEEAILTK